MTTATLTLNVPNNYISQLNDNVFEKYLNEFIVEYIEAKEDKELRHGLAKNKKFADLNNKIDKVL